MTSLRPRHLPYSLPFPSTDTWTHPATILPRTTTIPSTMLAGRWARGEAWPSPDCPSPVPGTAGGPVSGGFSGRKLANLSPPCFGGTIGSSEGDREKALGSGWGGVVCIWGFSKAVPREVWGGRWLEGQRGCTHSSCFLFSSRRVPYLAVARTFEKIEEVSAR